MNIQILKATIMAILLSLVTSYIVYFGFTTNYTLNLFSKESFEKQYDHGIYKYRIFSKYLLLKMDETIESSCKDKSVDSRIKFIDKNGTNHFYLSYFYINTIFLVLISVLLVLIFESNKIIKVQSNEKALIIFLSIVIINITQFVITPYDTSSYFFQLLIILIYFRYFDNYFIFSLFLICLLLIISTINRESSALSLSFLVMMIFLRNGFSKKSIGSIVVIIFSFLVTYFAVRFFINNTEIMIMQSNLLKGNLTHYPNLIGLLFWGLLLYLSLIIANSNENRYIIILIHLMSIPYILMCFFTGVLFEVRLYVPLFLSSIILSKISTENFKLHLPQYIYDFKFSNLRNNNSSK